MINKPNILSSANLAIMLTLLAGIGLLYKTNSGTPGDYANYYYASRIYLAGDFGEGVYEPFLFNQKVAKMSPQAVYVNYTPVPPLSVIFYLPFAMIPEVTLSKFLFSGLGLIFFAIALLKTLKALQLKHTRALLLLPFVFYLPLFNNFHQGQSYLYLSGFLLLGFTQWHKKNWLAAGLLFALPMALKIYPVVLLLWMIIAKEYKVLRSTVAWLIFFAFLTAATLPMNVCWDYSTHILPRLFQGQINDPFAVQHQSVSVLLRKAFVFDKALNPAPIVNLPFLSEILNGFFQWLVFIFSMAVLACEKTGTFFKIGFTILSGFLLSGYAVSYNLILLSLLCVELVLSKRYIQIIMLFLAGFIPVYKVLDLPLGLQFPRVYLLLALWGTLVYYCRPILNYKIASVLLFLMFVKVIYFPTVVKPESEYYLDDPTLGIIYHYEVRQGQVALNCFNHNGAEQRLIPVKDHIWPDQDLSVHNGQVHFNGNAITASKSRKRLPMRLNAQEFLYLSDEGRGVGFYALRKQRLP